MEWFNAVDSTYKADLYELNERNFQRFDDKLERRLGELRAELLQQIGELRGGLGQRITELRLESQRDLAETKSSLLRWMFGFWVGTLAPLAGLVIYLTR